MKEFQRKRKIRRLLYSRLSLLILFILIALVAKGTWNVYTKERDSRKQLERVEEELAALEARDAALQNKIDRLKTSEGIEAEIREQFQVTKPGERMVVIVEEGGKSEEAAAPRQSLISKFFDLFR